MFNLVEDRIFHSTIKVTGDITDREITDASVGFCLKDLFNIARNSDVIIIGKVASLEVMFTLCSMDITHDKLYFKGVYCNHSATGYSVKTKFIEFSKVDGKYYLNSHTSEV